MQGTHTFTLGTVDALGVVHLSPAGHDLIRALLLRGMNRAKRGLASAEHYKKLGADDLTAGSITYYRHAMAFMSHLIHSDNGRRVDISEELQEIRAIPPGESYPPAWKPFLVLAQELTVSDVPPIAPGVGDRGDRVGEPEQPAPKRNRRRKRDTGAADGSGDAAGD